MQNIIKVTKNEIGNAELNSVNAKEIHDYLQVKTRFDMWIGRAISKYDFKENIDFCTILGESSGGRKATEYIVTMDMAKELAMLENNPKGKETRKYFINCEKELQKSSPYAALQEIVAFQKKQLDQLQGIGDILIKQQVQISNLANIVTNLSKQNLCDVAQNEQNINITLHLKSDKDLMSEENLSFNEISILRILVEKKELLDRRVVNSDSYYKLTIASILEYFPIKISEKTAQRALQRLKDKKLIQVMNRFDGNYIKLNEIAKKLMGGVK